MDKGINPIEFLCIRNTKKKDVISVERFYESSTVVGDMRSVLWKIPFYCGVSNVSPCLADWQAKFLPFKFFHVYKSIRILFVIMVPIYTGTVLHSQPATLDWKLHNVGKVHQVVTNTGGMNAKYDDLFDYPRLINCEFPPWSEVEHLTEGGIWIGTIIGADTLVSVAQGEGSPREFYPTAALWDSIWVIGKGDIVDLPYWPNYVGVSDQDFVCKYSDYSPASLQVSSHIPVYIDIIQTSYAWSSPPLDEFILFNYSITSTQIDLHNVYITNWINGNVGYIQTAGFGLDDETYFRRDKLLQVCVDLPGGDDWPSGTEISAVATKFYPPENENYLLDTTFIWYNGRLQGLPGRDSDRYEQMASGQIMQNQVSTGDGTKSMISVGPYELIVGDTLHFKIALILGDWEEGILRNVNLLDKLIEKDFKIPSPPPIPPLRVETYNHQVILKWEPTDEVNPETYPDPNRADNITQPFEGYRVYKSTQSINGPWTLLAEYDLSRNVFGHNTGLVYEYVDVGLLNNLEYYYTVTAFSKPDTTYPFPSQESSLNANAKIAVPGTAPPKRVGKVAVVPNPYRGDISYHSYNPPWEKPSKGRPWMEQDRRIQFINLPTQCEIKIYTLAGDLVRSLSHNDPDKGYEDWDLTSSVGQAISSGIYLFTVEDARNGQVQVGKFVVIK